MKTSLSSSASPASAAATTRNGAASPEFDDATALIEKLAPLDPGARLEALVGRFPGQLVASTSAGAQSAVLLDLLQRHAPGTPVVWVDTGYHFGETYEYFETLKQRFDRLRFIEVAPLVTAARQEALFGKRWEQDAEALVAYNLQNKVEPMNRALSQLDARVWISGLRADQSAHRARRPLVEQQNRTLKVYPILEMTDAEVDSYQIVRELPLHPLISHGYLSIGDWHSSRPARAGEAAEATRFNGLQRECGLHELSNQPDFQI